MSVQEGNRFVTDQLIFNIDFNNPLSYALCKNLIMNSSVPFSDGRAVASTYNGINLYSVTSDQYTAAWYSWSSINGNSNLFSIKSGNLYTFSFYAKPGTTDWLLCSFVGGGGETYSDSKAVKVPASGGRVFCTLTANASVDQYVQVRIQTPTGGSKTFSMGGVQLEEGGFMSDYFPSLGNIVKDISGRGRQTTLLGSPVIKYSSPGTVSFNGSSQYGSTSIKGNNESDFYSSSFTLGAFAKLDTANTGDSWLYDLDYVGYRLWGGNNTVFMVRGPSAGWETIGYSFNVGQWYYVCVTMIDNGTSNNVAVYINGSLVGTYTIGQKNFAAVGGIDHFATAAHYGFGSKKPFTIGNIHQYKKVLSATEVAQNFNSLRGRYGI
jgi:hypothetical protein